MSPNGSDIVPKAGSIEPSNLDEASAPLDLDDLRYEPLSARPSKVALANLGHPLPPDPRFDDWLDSLPRLLGASALKRLSHAIACALSRRPAGCRRDWGTCRQDRLCAVPD